MLVITLSTSQYLMSPCLFLAPSPEEPHECHVMLMMSNQYHYHLHLPFFRLLYFSLVDEALF